MLCAFELLETRWDLSLVRVSPLDVVPKLVVVDLLPLVLMKVKKGSNFC